MHEKGMEYLSKAARLGSLDASLQIGLWYRQAQKYEEAFEFIQKVHQSGRGMLSIY